jgi:uncharacterized RDD family membrane protein YckC
MKTRSRLDDIEDMNFAVVQMIYKGKSKDNVIDLLKSRGTPPEGIADIIKRIEVNYQGVKRILCSKTKRTINFIIDLLLLAGILFFPVSSLPKENYNLYLTIIILLSVFIGYIIPETLWGQTLGKLVTNTIVVDENGKKPGIFSVIIRTVLRANPVSSAIYAFGNDYPKHDKHSKTYVVSKERWRELYDQY